MLRLKILRLEVTPTVLTKLTITNGDKTFVYDIKPGSIHLNINVDIEPTTLILDYFGYKKSVDISKYVHSNIDSVKSFKVGNFFIKIGLRESKKSETIEESLTHSKTVTTDTIELGMNTLALLKSQDKKLEKSSANVDQIDQDIKISKRELRSIHSVSGQIANSLTSAPTEKEKVVKQHTITSIVMTNHQDDLEQIRSNVRVLKTIALEMDKQLDNSINTIDQLEKQTETANVGIKSTRRKIKREFH